jgi:TonB family protein
MRWTRTRIAGPALGFFVATASAFAQSRGAVQTKQVNPVYPDNLLKTEQQGNVLLIGRIDTQGHVQDLLVVSASNPGFSPAALAAAKQWEFRPATRDGKPIEVFANIAIRFRLQNDKRGDIPQPILGDLAISPADASGKAIAPEGFPIRKVPGAQARAEARLDVPPSDAARTLTVTAEALSPKGKPYPVFAPPVAVPAKATEVKFPVVVKIGDGWEDGVWTLRLRIDGKIAGGGQFWVAKDPDHFHFVVPKS